MAAQQQAIKSAWDFQHLESLRHTGVGFGGLMPVRYLQRLLRKRGRDVQEAQLGLQSWPVLPPIPYNSGIRQQHILPKKKKAVTMPAEVRRQDINNLKYDQLKEVIRKIPSVSIHT